MNHRAEESKCIRRLPNVWKDAVHLRNRLLHRKATHRRPHNPEVPTIRPRLIRRTGNSAPIDGIEAADIVKSSHMIHVRMGQHDGIHLVDSVLNGREAHFGWRIN